MPSLYVHVPFCLKKCYYCAFFSVPVVNTLTNQIPQYLQWIAQEIKLRSLEAPVRVSSFFLGGGTPTALQAKELDELLGMIHQGYVFCPRGSIKHKAGTSIPLGEETAEKKVEKTAEANPGTLTAEKLAVLRSYGINRISLGAQSFNNQMLKMIGRIHTAEDIYAGIKLIRKAGIDNLNLDLIFGLPGQTLTDWQDTLRKAADISTEHLSLYALSLEEDTPFGRKYLIPTKDPKSFLQSLTLNNSISAQSAVEREDSPAIPDDDLQADMYEWAVEYLQNKGYKHYEISNFARPDFECLHNQTYWQGEDYIGLGPGAVSCLQGVRTKNIEDITFLNKLIQSGELAVKAQDTEILTREELITEYMILGLRTAKGIDLELFTRKFKVGIQDIYGHILGKYIDRGILIIVNGRLTLNQAYYFVANSILQDFVL